MVRMSPILGEPSRDPRLADALRRIDENPAGSDDGLRHRIMEAARPALASLRLSSRPWWVWLTAWVRVAVPVAVATCVAAALVIPGSDDLAATGISTALPGADSTIVLAAFSEPGTSEQLTAHLIAPDTSDWLLTQALNQ